MLDIQICISSWFCYFFNVELFSFIGKLNGSISFDKNLCNIKEFKYQIDDLILFLEFGILELELNVSSIPEFRELNYSIEQGFNHF